MVQKNHTNPSIQKILIQTTSTTAGFWTESQYNGNIKGQAWRSVGDGVQRRYHYQYDNANRLLTAFYEQRNTAGVWSNTDMDFTFWTDHSGQSNPAAAYDLNGNILQFGHRGYKPGATTYSQRNIDVLNYYYFDFSNKLKAVSDGITTPQGLGDFTDKNTTADDYTYDADGNLITDKNKAISSIAYNELNLPSPSALVRVRLQKLA